MCVEGRVKEGDLGVSGWIGNGASVLCVEGLLSKVLIMGRDLPVLE